VAGKVAVDLVLRKAGVVGWSLATNAVGLAQEEGTPAWVVGSLEDL